jgi:hypothetical protein
LQHLAELHFIVHLDHPWYSKILLPHAPTFIKMKNSQTIGFYVPAFLAMAMAVNLSGESFSMQTGIE